VLYQLSYTHHVLPHGPLERRRPGNRRNDTRAVQAPGVVGGVASPAARTDANVSVT
jgi:hypothetical protein